MEHYCQKGLRDQVGKDSLCQKWAECQSIVKNNDTCDCCDIEKHAALVAVITEERKKRIFDLPRKIVAYMSTAIHIPSFVVRGQDVWCAKGQFMRDLPPNHITTKSGINHKESGTTPVIYSL